MIDVVKISKALSDPKRYQILKLLMAREQGLAPELVSGCCSGVCNCDIMEVFSLIQSKVSYHMKELVEAQLVKEEQQGKWKYYHLNRQTIDEYLKQLEADFLK